MLELLKYTVGMAASNCYVMSDQDTKEAVMVDPGDRADFLLREIRDRDLKLQAILLTHGHFDHIMAVPEIKSETSACVYAPAADRELMNDAQSNLSGPWQGRPTTVQADIWLDEGDEITVLGRRAQVLMTPGHTSGSCCYYLPEEGWLFSGDTLFRESYGRLDLPMAAPEKMADSVHRLLALPEETVVFPGHEENTTIAHERKYNPLSNGI